MECENSIVDLSNLSSEIISENDLPCLLENYETQALKFIENKSYTNAITQIKRLEDIMESVSAQGGVAYYEYIVATLQNMAFCYQESNEVAKAKNYIDACFFNAKSANFMPKSVSNSEFSIKKSKYISKLAIIYSFLSANTQDFKNSEKILAIAQTHSTKALQETFKACKRLSNHYKNKGKATYSKIEQKKIVLIERALPALESINEFTSKGIIKKVKMRSALGIRSYPDWAVDFDLDTLSKIVPISSGDFYSILGIQAELSKDSILYKVLLLIASLFYRGMCLKTLGDFKQSLSLLKSAFQLVSNFFPLDSSAYQKVFEGLESAKNLKSAAPNDRKIRRNLSVDFSGKLNYLKL